VADLNRSESTRRCPRVDVRVGSCVTSIAGPNGDAQLYEGEGRPFGFGDQVADPKSPRAATVKSRGGERRGNAGTMIPAGMVERGERKQTASEASKADQVMSKPGADPSSGISSEDVLIPTERHPACRQREARPGSCMERENLAGDGKGKDAMGRRRGNCIHRRRCEPMEPPQCKRRTT
jgi:hypothetical protein